MHEMNARHGGSDARCSNCNKWAGTLGDAEIQETVNGNGVNWTCPECGKLVGTANY